VSFVYTPTTRWQDGLVHIASYAKRVNLGFNQGASLDDPLGILAGTGSKIRHVSFHGLGDLDAPWVEEYVRAAAEHVGVSTDAGDGGTTVRVSSGSKRRPV
jgi:hypothetical protein